MIRFEWPQFIQRFRERMSIRLLILAAVTLAGGYALYEGSKHLGSKPDIVKKRIIQPTNLAGNNAAEGAEGQTNLGQPGTVPPGETGDASSNDLYPAGGSSRYSLSESPSGNTGAYQGYSAAPACVATEENGAAPDNRLRAASAVAEEGQSPDNQTAAEATSKYANSYTNPAETSPAAETAEPGLMAPPPAAGAYGHRNPPASLSKTASARSLPAATPPATTPPESGPATGSTYGSTYNTPNATVEPPLAVPEQPLVQERPANPPPVRPRPVASLAPANAGVNNSGSLGASNPGAFSTAAALPAAAAALATAGGMSAGPIPGDRQLEGVQTPSVMLEKSAPSEIQVGRPATFEMRVRNVGQVAAHQVTVSDHIPRGTQLQGTKPEATQAADGTLVWQLGTIPPGQEVSLAMQVIPEQEGEIGSVAQVGFAAQASARSICTKPQLKIQHDAPKQILIGQAMTMSIMVENPGSGAATNVVIEEDVPEGLVHEGGRELEYEIGTLRPGESRRLDLQLRADKAGIVNNAIVVRGEGNLIARHDVQIEVVAPQLQVAIDGPKKRFLQRAATYTLNVSNPGTAAARNVEMVAYLPKGMQFVQADAQGQYDQRQHAVFWSLEELPLQKKGTVHVTAMPVEPGEQKIRVEGRAELGLTAAQEQAIQVDAVTELAFTIADLADPVEVGGENTYEVRVVNNGSRVVTNVKLVAALPQGVSAKEGAGPTAASTDGQKVTFEPVARMNPQDELVFKIHAQALAEGDHLIRVQLSCDEFPTAVTKEESTRVYADR